MFLSLLIALLALAAGFAFGSLRARREGETRAQALQSELEKARAQAAEAQATAARAETLLEAERQHAEAERTALRAEAAKAREQQAEALRTEFRAVAAELAQSEGRTLRTQHLNTLEELLKPLGKDIEAFREQFLTGHAAMKQSVADLVAQTSHVGREAQELANALRANTKLQGNWGEAVLTRLLEASGLTEGRDFTVQARTQSDDGRTLIPDVVVHLPGKRAVVVDSKVSLTDFTRLVALQTAADGGAGAPPEAAPNPEADAPTKPANEARLLKAHVDSVRRHVKELSEKRYDKEVKGAIGYVLMFIPSEAAYVAAVNADPTLTTDAYARRVIILNPTNLLMALQLAYNLWQTELQSDNVREIYKSADALYHKFATFAKSFTAIGDGIKRLGVAYDTAEKQLTTGRGNVISQLKNWEKKGLIPSAALPEQLLAKHNDARTDTTPQISTGNAQTAAFEAEEDED